MTATVGKFFRLSPEHAEKLETLAKAMDMPEVDVIRLFIDSVTVKWLKEQQVRQIMKENNDD